MSIKNSSKTLSFTTILIVFMIILSIFTVMIISSTDEADGVTIGTVRNETIENWDDIHVYDLDEQEVPFGYYRSSDDHEEGEEEEYTVISDEGDYVGEMHQSTIEQHNKEGEWRMGRNPEEKDPIVYYQFEDAGSGWGEVAHDSSFYGHHGEIVGSPERSVSGGVHNTGYWDFSEYVNRRVERDYPNLFGDDSFALEFWFHPTGDVNNINLFNHYNTGSNSEVNIATDSDSDVVVDCWWEDKWTEPIDDGLAHSEPNGIENIQQDDDYIIHYQSGDSVIGYDIDGDTQLYEYNDIDYNFEDMNGFYYHDDALYLYSAEEVWIYDVVDESVKWDVDTSEYEYGNNMDIIYYPDSDYVVVTSTFGMLLIDGYDGSVAWDIQTLNTAVEIYDGYIYTVGNSISKHCMEIGSEVDSVDIEEDAVVESVIRDGDELYFGNILGNYYRANLDDMEIIDTGRIFTDDTAIIDISVCEGGYFYMVDEIGNLHFREKDTFDGFKLDDNDYNSTAVYDTLYASYCGGYGNSYLRSYIRGHSYTIDQSIDEDGWNYFFMGYDEENGIRLILKNDDGVYDELKHSGVGWDWEYVGDVPFTLFGGRTDLYGDEFRAFRHYDYGEHDEYTNHLKSAYFDSDTIEVDNDFYNIIEIETDYSDDVPFDEYEVTVYGEGESTTHSIDVESDTTIYDFQPMHQIESVQVYFSIDVGDDFVYDSSVMKSLTLHREAVGDFNVYRTPGEESVDGTNSYRLHVSDETDGEGYVNWDWHTTSDNMSEYEYSVIPPQSMQGVEFAFRFEYVTQVGDFSDNDMRIYEVEKFHDEHGEVENVEKSLLYDKSELHQDYWNDLSFSTHTVADSVGFMIEFNTDETFMGQVIMEIDYIRYNMQMSEVFPRFFNEFTGEGLDQDRLVVQYQDVDGQWRFISGDSFWSVKGMDVHIRVMDYWGQVVHDVTFEPRRDEELVRMPVPVINLEINRPELRSIDTPDWGLYTPWFQITSRSTQQSHQFNQWTMEIIGNRTYEFHWDGFAKFLSGSQVVDLSYHMDEPIFDFGGSESFAIQEFDSGGSSVSGIETTDSSVSEIKGGHAILDLELNIDPEATVGRPPLYPNPFEVLGGDSEHMRYFPEHLFTVIAYDIFRVSPSDYNPYVHSFPGDYFVALARSPVFAVMSFIIGVLALTWYIEIYTGAIQVTQRAKKNGEKKSFAEALAERDKFTKWLNRRGD